MSEEFKPADEGILGRAKRLASQAGDYARSDEARAKLDAVKRKAVEVGEKASTGAKKIAEGTKQAAVQAKEKADEFSKSEQAEVIRAKAKEGLDTVLGGGVRGAQLSRMPVVVGMALLLCPPLGLYLLWRHPTLSRRPKWWLAGGAWSLILAPMLFGKGAGGRLSGDQYQVIHGGRIFIVSEADSIDEIAKQVATRHNLAQINDFCLRFAEGIYQDMQKQAAIDGKFRGYSVAQLQSKYDALEPLVDQQARELVASRAKCLAQGSFDMADRLAEKRESILKELNDFHDLIETRKLRGK